MFWFDKYHHLLKRYPLIILDLDNTIYPESTWLYAAYKKISELSPNPDLIYKSFVHLYVTEGRNHIFQKIRKLYPHAVGSNKDWLDIMHHQSPHLYPYHWFAPFMNRYLDSSICVLTNGHPSQQINKYFSLRLHQWIKLSNFFCANLYQPKPSPKVGSVITHYFNLHPSDVLMIGDSSTDEEFCLNSGFQFIKSPQ